MTSGRTAVAGPPRASEPAAFWSGAAVTVAEIARRLAELRAQAAAGRPHGRSTLLNLVVWAPAGSELAAASTLLDVLVGPSRIIVLTPDARATGIGAHLEVHARPSVIDHGVICEELVRLTLAPDIAAHAASVVTPLVRGDLPTFVWWPGPPEPATAAYRQLAEAADRLVTEAERGKGGAEALTLVADDVELREAATTDLAWGALTPWRQLMAQLLGPPQIAALRRGPSEAVLAHAGMRPTLRALLLAGWLRDLLGDGLRVGFRPTPEVSEGLAGFQLQGPSGQRLQAQCRASAPSCSVNIAAPGVGTRSRTLPMRQQSRTELIAGELEIRGPDRSFERAVSRARALLGD